MGVTVFFDTMMYLHYRSLPEINLCAELGADAVKVVVPMVTIEELDKHKNDHRNRKRQDRARAALNLIKLHAMQGAPIRNGVTMEVFRIAPFDYASHKLNENKNDDVLIASVIGYRSAHPDENVFLISEDIGPQITAQILNVPQAELDEKYRLPNQPDENEQELVRLRKENTELKHALPKPSVYFKGGRSDEPRRAFQISSPTPFDERGAEAKLAALARQHPELPKSDGLSFNYRDPSIVAVPSNFPEKHNKARNEFLTRYHEYLLGTYRGRVQRALSLLVELRIQNTGSTPAKDLSLALHFPADLQICTCEEFPWGPPEPTPPKILNGPDLGQPSWGIVAELARQDAGRMAALTKPTLKTDASVAYFNTHYLKHGEGVEVPSLYVLFESLEQGHSFRCDYEFRVGNLPKPVTGYLDFVVQKQDNPPTKIVQL